MPVTPDEHFASLEARDGKQPAGRPRIPTGGPDDGPPQTAPEPAGEPLARDPYLLDLLREVIDPELGVDIVGLGLLREARVEGRTAHVAFTVTMPACPMAEYLESEIRRCLEKRAEIDAVIVRLVNQPPWTPTDMSDDVRATLGWER